MKIKDLRQTYHQRICRDIIRVKLDPKKGIDYPNFADCGNTSSVKIATGITKQLNCTVNRETISEQRAAGLFEKATSDFLHQSFELLQHLRPGKWHYATTQAEISRFSQYEHPAYLENVLKKDKTLSAASGGDYIVKPDIVIGRYPVEDEEINRESNLVGRRNSIATLTPFRQANNKKATLLLHASISCKWTIGTETLNLIPPRKGHLPHVVAVTAEPLPTRVAALALGTGYIDCIYHFALPELKAAIEELQNEDMLDILSSMIDGKRLRDISDLPFDLAI